MKAGIVGIGAVGKACALATVVSGSARELVLVDRTKKKAEAVATDMRYGAPLSAEIIIRDGDYDDLAGAGAVMITAGVNEKTGGATGRSDPSGRLKLLATNARIYEEIVPPIVRAAPDAVLIVVTDPPDPLAGITRKIAGHDRVLSTGTFLDSLRFRTLLARYSGVSPSSAEAQVLGEHGTSEVFLWSSARVAGVPVLKEISRQGLNADQFKSQIEHEVRFANITIIEGNNASQYGIGMVSARITKAVLRDERLAIPIGSYQAKYGVTFSLPSVIGRAGVIKTLEPELSEDEQQALEHSADVLKKALSEVSS
jgi:L-lactate dehydrogenase